MRGLKRQITDPSTSFDFLRFILRSLNHAWEFLPLVALQRCGGKEEVATTSHRDVWGGKRGFQGALGIQMGIMDPSGCSLSTLLLEEAAQGLCRNLQLHSRAGFHPWGAGKPDEVFSGGRVFLLPLSYRPAPSDYCHMP